MVSVIFDKFITFVITSFFGPSLNTLVENGPIVGLSLKLEENTRPISIHGLKESTLRLEADINYKIDRFFVRENEPYGGG